ncbi:hypothetical protein AABM34_11915 [Lysinibacillus fusiformis]
MLVKLLEPLNVSDSIIEKLAEPIKQSVMNLFIITRKQQIVQN